MSLGNELNHHHSMSNTLSIMKQPVSRNTCTVSSLFLLSYLLSIAMVYHVLDLVPIVLHLTSYYYQVVHVLMPINIIKNSCSQLLYSLGQACKVSRQSLKEMLTLNVVMFCLIVLSSLFTSITPSFVGHVMSYISSCIPSKRIIILWLEIPHSYSLTHITL